MSFLNISLLSLSEIFGDFALEKFAHTGSYTALGAGIFGYITIVIFLIRSMIYADILRVNLLWNGMTTIFESLAAVLFLGESFAEPSQWLGAGLTVAGLFLIKFTPK